MTVPVKKKPHLSQIPEKHLSFPLLEPKVRSWWMDRKPFGWKVARDQPGVSESEKECEAEGEVGCEGGREGAGVRVKRVRM